jgi:hypothetical protein
MFVVAGVGIGAGPVLSTAVTRGVIVDLAERAIVVRDSRISRRPGIFRVGPVVSLFGCYSMSVLNGFVSAIVCYLAVEIFNISQLGCAI